MFLLPVNVWAIDLTGTGKDDNIQSLVQRRQSIIE